MTREQYAFEERAAIIQEGCRVTRERAERMAREQMEQAAKRGKQEVMW